MTRGSPATPLWPEGKRFAFTVFDDPDGQGCATSRVVYEFLQDLGFRTTKAVWPIGPLRPPNSGGDTCASAPFREHVIALQQAGFEIAFHNAAPHTATRQETIEALARFQEYFGEMPRSMANHYNGEAIYWGEARLSGSRRIAYRAVTLNRNSGAFRGHVEGDPHFWGDLCRSHIRYCRNFVFRDINTLRACPQMPYHDDLRPYVNLWFASSEGAQGPAFLHTIREREQDRLEEEGGACIMYTHFGHGFVEDGRIVPRFRHLMERLSRKNGWFVPVSTLLDYLAAARGDGASLSPADRRRLEWKWLRRKLLNGTS